MNLRVVLADEPVGDRVVEAPLRGVVERLVAQSADVERHPDLDVCIALDPAAAAPRRRAAVVAACHPDERQNGEHGEALQEPWTHPSPFPFVAQYPALRWPPSGRAPRMFPPGAADRQTRVRAVRRSRDTTTQPRGWRDGPARHRGRPSGARGGLGLPFLDGDGARPGRARPRRDRARGRRSPPEPPGSAARRCDRNARRHGHRIGGADDGAGRPPSRDGAARRALSAPRRARARDGRRDHGARGDLDRIRGGRRPRRAGVGCWRGRRQRSP